MGQHQPAEAAIHPQQREQPQHGHAQHQVRDDDRREEQAVEKALAGKAVAGDGQPGRHRDQRCQGRREGGQLQAVVEGGKEIRPLEHGGEPA